MPCSKSALQSCAIVVLLCSAFGVLANTPGNKQILTESKPSEWRTPDPANTLVMQLAGKHRIVIELAPAWAPAHVANIRTLLKQHYFDNTSVYRVQDNFVVQWGYPDSDTPGKARSMGSAKTTLPAEFTRNNDASFEFTRLPDGDLYAPEVGFSDSMPVARNRMAGQAWLLNCYGMLGVARDVDPGTGNGNTLYVPIGPARRIDHQLAVVGRVIEGMPWLSSLPRGPAPMGMYTDNDQRTRIAWIRLASDLAAKKRPHLQVLRSDSQSFARLLEARRNRQDDFYKYPVGSIGVCDVPLPVRQIP